MHTRTVTGEPSGVDHPGGTSRPPARPGREPGHADLVAELAALSSSFETAAAGEVISWAARRFGPRLVVACSFQDAVIVDLVVAAAPGTPVVFLDTGAHFPETLAYVEEIRARYDLPLRVVRPGPDAADHPCGSARCCELRKVEPLRAVLADVDAWITGLKRVDAPTRAGIPIVALDAQWGKVKVNPLATWSEDDVAGYEADHGLPRHPLMDRGYRSIGCAPTTRPVAPGEDPRAGRWAGTGKVECGLHGS